MFFKFFFVMACFDIISKDFNARTGILKTAHGEIKSPFFMPVATKGAVKNILHSDLKKMNFDCIISNAFINYLKPGLPLIKKAGGFHKFISWDKSIFTDSGGFQLILDHFYPKITNKGVTMTNPFNKNRELISPEKSIEIQNILGSDVAMVLDHQPVFGKERKDYLESAIRTIEWGQRCYKYHKNNFEKVNSKQLLFGIAQGGNYLDVRQKCAFALSKIGFDSIALGGFGIGEAQSDMCKIIKGVKKVLPENNCTYIMGIGSPLEILGAVENGADCFDSVYPTRMARHGLIFTSSGQIKIDKSIYKNNFSSIDTSCDCFVCKNYSLAYLHHLFKMHEQNAHILLSYHNIFFIQNLMKNIRISINENEFERFKKDFEYKFKRV
jgi:queuine tRNA-ribosyltransferase